MCTRRFQNNVNKEFSLKDFVENDDNVDAETWSVEIWSAKYETPATFIVSFFSMLDYKQSTL